MLSSNDNESSSPIRGIGSFQTALDTNQRLEFDLSEDGSLLFGGKKRFIRLAKTGRIIEIALRFGTALIDFNALAVTSIVLLGSLCVDFVQVCLRLAVRWGSRGNFCAGCKTAGCLFPELS